MGYPKLGYTVRNLAVIVMLLAGGAGVIEAAPAKAPGGSGKTRLDVGPAPDLELSGRLLGGLNALIRSDNVTMAMDESGKYVITFNSISDAETTHASGDQLLSSWWAGTFGHGLACHTEMELGYGATLYWGAGAISPRAPGFGGLPPEMISRLVIADYWRQTRGEKRDEYGHLAQPAGSRTRLINECVLTRGNASKFDWAALQVEVWRRAPDAVRREAASVTKCRKVNGPWPAWQ